jgi:F-box protein 9
MDNTELESFRRQWLEEVARKKQPQQHQQQQHSARDTTKRPPQPQHLRGDNHQGDDADAASAAPIGYETLAKEVRSLSISTDPDDTLVPDAHAKPTSALEHFEQAVSREAQGMLGESLDLYRKAYKVCQCASTFVRLESS